MDNKWYNFNDRRVEKIENNIEDSIVTKDAYVLFYKLKNIDVINWDDIYEKKFVNIIDDCFKVYNLNGLNNKNSTIHNYTENGSNYLTNDTNYNISYNNQNNLKNEDNKKIKYSYILIIIIIWNLKKKKMKKNKIILLVMMKLV